MVTAEALGSFLALIADVFEWMLEQVGTVITTISGNPALFVSVFGALALIVIGIFARLFRMGIG